MLNTPYTRILIYEKHHQNKFPKKVNFVRLLSNFFLKIRLLYVKIFHEAVLFHITPHSFERRYGPWSRRSWMATTIMKRVITPRGTSSRAKVRAVGFDVVWSLWCTSGRVSPSGWAFELSASAGWFSFTSASRSSLITGSIPTHRA